MEYEEVEYDGGDEGEYGGGDNEREGVSECGRRVLCCARSW